GDAARVPTAQAVHEIAGRPLPGGRGLRRGLGKVTVVGREVGGQEGLGPRAGLDPAEAELGDEAVLEGGPQAFDATLGLGRVRGDVADPEVPQDLAELGGMLRALELLLKGPVRI